MRKLFKILFLLLTLSFALSVPAMAGEVDEAKTFFDRYVKLCHTYNSSLTSLYSDRAVIKRTLILGDSSRTVIIPLKEYIGKLKAYRLLAKAMGYKNYYYNLKFRPENGNVRVEGMRRVSIDNYTGPVSMLLGKDKQGHWEILEDITTTKNTKLMKN